MNPCPPPSTASRCPLPAWVATPPLSHAPISPDTGPVQSAASPFRLHPLLPTAAQDPTTASPTQRTHPLHLHAPTPSAQFLQALPAGHHRSPYAA